jgi:hypothetical protein
MTHFKHIIKNEQDLDKVVADVAIHNFANCMTRKVFVVVNRNDEVLKENGFPMLIVADWTEYEHTPFGLAVKSSLRKEYCKGEYDKITPLVLKWEDDIRDMLR